MLSPISSFCGLLNYAKTTEWILVKQMQILKGKCKSLV